MHRVQPCTIRSGKRLAGNVCIPCSPRVVCHFWVAQRSNNTEPAKRSEKCGRFCANDARKLKMQDIWRICGPLNCSRSTSFFCRRRCRDGAYVNNEHALHYATLTWQSPPTGSHNNMFTVPVGAFIFTYLHKMLQYCVPLA